MQRLDRQNLVNIYGPERGEGNMKPWAGYRGYRGSLPMDGVSVIYAIRQSGLCLVLSTDPHLEDGLVSMRMFEGLAAGVPLICDRNPFIQRFFGDNVFYIDTGSTFALSKNHQSATTEVHINPMGVAVIRMSDAATADPKNSIEGQGLEKGQGLGQRLGQGLGQGEGLGQGQGEGLGQELGHEPEEEQRLDPVDQIVDHIAYIRDHPEVGGCNCYDLFLQLDPIHSPHAFTTSHLLPPHIPPPPPPTHTRTHTPPPPSPYPPQHLSFHSFYFPSVFTLLCI